MVLHQLRIENDELSCSGISLSTRFVKNLSNDFCLCVVGVSVNVQSNYSSALTTNNPVCSPDHCLVANHYYEAIQLAVSSSGCYTLISKSTVNILGYIYIHSFNVFNPNFNAFVHHNVDENNVHLNFIVQLQTAINYALVVSTFLPNEIGSFSITASGANKVTFNRMSK